MSQLIYFIRHGQTDWNAEMRFQGQKDIPLNDKGRGQAKRNGEALRGLISADDFDFVASPLGRTRETMEILRTAMSLEPNAYRMDDRLRELSFGEWEGRTVSDLEVNEVDDWAQRQADKWNFQPPNGESYHILTERVRGWTLELDKPTVVVAHGGINRALRAIYTDEDITKLAAAVIPQDKIMVVEGSKVTWV
ncbi:MAG: histidine phosphatase family protein [Hyphomicrobiales bacterium]